MLIIFYFILLYIKLYELNIYWIIIFKINIPVKHVGPVNPGVQLHVLGVSLHVPPLEQGFGLQKRSKLMIT